MVLNWATALEQKGHWKSENSTSVIFASAGPVEGELAVGMFTAFSNNLPSGVCAYLDAFASATAAASVLPFLNASTITDAMPLLNPQPGSFTRHSAIFMPQPHEQSCVRMAFRALIFCAGVRPLISTAGRDSAFCQSCASRSAAPNRQSPEIQRVLAEKRCISLL